MANSVNPDQTAPVLGPYSLLVCVITCWKRADVCDVFVWGQVWYLIISISDLLPSSLFLSIYFSTVDFTRVLIYF